VDGETACRDEVRLVFAVDQPAFDVGPNRFCVLYPLMSVDGDRFADLDEEFPYRGRIWWLLRSTLTTDLVVQGALWTGTIEPARHGEKDRFQARLHDIQPGDPDLVEVLDIPQADPGLDWVHRQRGLQWPRPTAPRVILRGRSSVLGPLGAVWDPTTQRLRLSAPPGEDAEVLKVPLEEFQKAARVEEFKIELGEHTRNPSDRKPITLALTKTAWLNLKRLREAGEPLDASTDAQVVTWATRHMPRKQRQQIQTALQELREADPPATDGGAAARKRERLRQIVADRERVLELGEEVARGLAETPAFEDLIRKHADALVEQRVAEATRRRTEEIEAQTKARRDELNRIEAKLETLKDDFRKQAEAEEQALRDAHAARDRDLQGREAALAAREGALDHRRGEIQASLDKAVDHYQTETDRVVAGLLEQWPILRRLAGTVGDGSNHAPAPAPAAPAAPAALALPAFLAAGKGGPDGQPPAEGDFLIQFQQVVKRRGFTFALEDLINLHACVKTGGLTILAGPSGTGKSSLPRLYAEALGCLDEYLHVPVRPDWLDDRDLIGAFNAIAGRFEPAGAGLVERLIAAAADRARGRGGIYPVCLDEMNLARVEHYFAQFLSVLELPPEARAITLFAPGLAATTDPYYPHQRVPIGENVRFLGTVNIDETTHFFSPKVLDRAQVVAFVAPDLAAPGRTETSGVLSGLRPVPLATYLSWARRAPQAGEARDFLLKVNDVLKRSRLGLGFRQRDRVLDYVASARDFLAVDRALDFQLMQVVLPRLRPTAPNYKETLRALQEIIARPRFPRAADMLGRILESPAENDFFQLL